MWLCQVTGQEQSFLFFSLLSKRSGLIPLIANEEYQKKQQPQDKFPCTANSVELKKVTPQKHQQEQDKALLN